MSDASPPDGMEPSGVFGKGKDKGKGKQKRVRAQLTLRHPGGGASAASAASADASGAAETKRAKVAKDKAGGAAKRELPPLLREGAPVPSSLYELLGVDHDAENVEIRKAYLQKSKCTACCWPTPVLRIKLWARHAAAARCTSCLAWRAAPDACPCCLY